MTYAIGGTPVSKRFSMRFLKLTFIDEYGKGWTGKKLAYRAAKFRALHPDPRKAVKK
jgi:hypothetical protein